MNIHPKSIYKKKRERHLRYQKSTDAQILSQIKCIIKLRPTYGYKRVTTMVNRLRSSLELNSVNKKRIYRVTSMNSLLLPKIKKLRTHIPTGKVMTLKSNTRWCSDCFEIKCFNGEKVYVIFVLDTCDREIINFIALDRPILSSDVQEIMLSSVEKRFHSTRAPRNLEFLSDRGSIYRALKTVEIGRSLNLKSCFTAAYSPESNGMAEAFVKTIKRDYVYVNDCETAEKTIDQINCWIKDYNEVAPHSALGMRSPKEYYKIKSIEVA